jgi:hypothetical protein
MTTQAEASLSEPISEQVFIDAGKTPEEARSLKRDFEIAAGRGARLPVELPTANPPASATPASPEAQARLDRIMQDRSAGRISDWEWRSTYEKEVQGLMEQLAAGRERAADLAHLDSVYAPAKNAWDYRVPQLASGQITDEGRAADIALTRMLHAERAPVHLGDAIMRDLAAGRPTDKSAETTAALRPWIQSMLTSAQANPALRPFVEGASVDRLLAMLSPETVTALIPWTQFRAARRQW